VKIGPIEANVPKGSVPEVDRTLMSIVVVEKKQQEVLSEYAYKKYSTMTHDDDYQVKTVNYVFPYERVDKVCLYQLFHNLGIRNDHFNGAMGRALTTLVKDQVYNNYLLSKKMDGVRAWLFVYKRKIYMQLRDNRFYFFWVILILVLMWFVIWKF